VGYFAEAVSPWVVVAGLLAIAPLPAQTLRVKLPEGIVGLDIEEYVAAALAGEAGGFQSEQALQAMAVVARTYARVNRGRHRAEGFDYCETTHCQDLLLRAVNDRVRRATSATEGVILWGDGRPARVFYHAHCGGHTESAAVLWRDSARPWLSSLADAACGLGKWSARIPAEQLGFAQLEVEARSVSGRVTRLRTERGPLSAGELHRAIGRNLGWDLLRSTLYQVRKQGEVFVFEGRGHGHGVGLCQSGAEARGRAGATWQQILAHYFPGATVRQTQWLRRRGERMEAEVAAEGDAWVIGAAERALAEAERRSGIRCARPPRLRVYGTVQGFRDETGEPGFMAASTRRGVVRLQPPGKLGAALTSVLLHEMLHVLLQQSGQKMALWEEEGRVMLLAGAQCPPAPLRPQTEMALTSPRNELEMRAAYRNACAAVALRQQAPRPAVKK
jgi:stage II sporulation protein D